MTEVMERGQMATRPYDHKRLGSRHSCFNEAAREINFPDITES